MDAGSIVNNATVTGTPRGGLPPVTDDDGVTVTAATAPAIQLVKSAAPATIATAGTPITYTFTVTNTGNASLVGVAVTDPLAGLPPVTCVATTLAPGAATTCSATYPATQADVDAGSIVNTATVAATTLGGTPVSDSDTATVVATQTPSVTMLKAAAPASVANAGATVTYTFSVTNTGNVTLSSVGITDPLPGLGAVTCLATTLAPAASTTCTAAYTVTQADIDAGSITNSATASGTPPSGPAVQAVDGAVVSVTQTPVVSIVKSASPSTITAAGQTVTYSFLVTNAGNVTLTAVSVADPLPGLSAVTCPVATLAPGATATCTATYVATQADVDAGSIANTATVTGTPPFGPPVTGTSTTTVTIPATPAITLVTSQASATNVTEPPPVQTIAYTFAVTQHRQRHADTVSRSPIR